MTLPLLSNSRSSRVGVVVDQAGQEGDQTDALFGGEWGEKLILHAGEHAVELAESAATGRSHCDDVTAAIAGVEGALDVALGRAATTGSFLIATDRFAARLESTY